MNISLTRNDRNDHRCIGVLTMPSFTCYTLEDTDRGLKQDMPIEGIKAIKIPQKTAIPYGTYEVVVSFSNRFQKMLPLLLNVPGFEGIRIHSGNFEGDTDGCILLGMNKSIDSITQSRTAMSRFMTHLMMSLKSEKCYVNIVKW